MNRSNFVLAKDDKLLSGAQQREFADSIGASEIIEISAPHFVVQTNASKIAQIISKNLQSK